MLYGEPPNECYDKVWGSVCCVWLGVAPFFKCLPIQFLDDVSGRLGVSTRPAMQVVFFSAIARLSCFLGVHVVCARG